MMNLPNDLPSRSEIEAEKIRRGRNRISSYYLDEGPLRRELYPKHLSFFAAGAEYRERLFIAGNRVGKTTVGGFEVACHLTGSQSAGCLRLYLID